MDLKKNALVPTIFEKKPQSSFVVFCFDILTWGGNVGFIKVNGVSVLRAQDSPFLLFCFTVLAESWIELPPLLPWGNFKSCTWPSVMSTATSKTKQTRDFKKKKKSVKKGERRESLGQIAICQMTVFPPTLFSFLALLSSFATVRQICTARFKHTELVSLTKPSAHY